MRDWQAMLFAPVGARHASPSVALKEGRGMPRPYASIAACVLSLFVLSTMLSACVSTAVKPASSADTDWPLLSPASLRQARQVSQVLRGDYAERSFTLRSVVTVNAQQLTVIGITSMGLRAFTLKYDGEHLDEQRAPQVPDALQAKQLLNDMQLAFWPLNELQNSWHTAGGEVSEPYPGTRRLQRNGVLLAEVHYASDPWNGRVWLRHFDYPYSLYIESSPLEKAQ
jgi:hypothetical protein